MKVKNMKLHKKFDLENEKIEYWIYDDGLKIQKDKRNEKGKLEEYFILYIYQNNDISFYYNKNVELAYDERKELKINKINVRNPLHGYTYEYVKNHLLHELKNDEERISFIRGLLQSYFAHYTFGNSIYID